MKNTVVSSLVLVALVALWAPSVQAMPCAAAPIRVSNSSRAGQTGRTAAAARRKTVVLAGEGEDGATLAIPINDVLHLMEHPERPGTHIITAGRLESSSDYAVTGLRIAQGRTTLARLVGRVSLDHVAQALTNRGVAYERVPLAYHPNLHIIDHDHDHDHDDHGHGHDHDHDHHD